MRDVIVYENTHVDLREIPGLTHGCVSTVVILHEKRLHPRLQVILNLYQSKEKDLENSGREQAAC